MSKNRMAKRLTLGMIGLVLCAGCALGQGAAQEQPAAPNTPAAPTTTRSTKVSRTPFATTTAGPTVNVNSSFTITENSDGRSLTVRGQGDEITAEINGKAVPPERVQRVGDRIVVRDENGEVVFDRPVMVATTASGSSYPALISRLSSLQSPLGGWTMSGDPVAAMAADPPTVMVGVQLVDIDSTLGGHFGLKEGEAALVAAVYEGLPASIAGLEPYDIIVSINGKAAGPEALRETLRASEANKPVSLEVIHRGQKKTVSVTPEKYDREKMEKAKVAAVEASQAAESITLTPGATAIGGLPGRTFVGKGSGSHDFMVFQAPKQWEEMQRRLEMLSAERAAQAGKFNEEMDKAMQERMRRMEEMMKTLMEQQRRMAPPAPPAAPGGQPGQPAPAGSSSSRLPAYDLNLSTRRV